MKLKYDFVINEVAGQFVAVAVGDGLTEFNGFIKLNDVGADIFNELKNDVTVDDVVNALKAKYSDTPDAEIKETVEEFVGKLKESNILA